MIRIEGILVSKGQGGVYSEKMIKGHRVWDPYRSKFAALAMIRKDVDLLPSQKVLYLGAANGTTVSHFADYVECVYAVEFAPRPMQDLIVVAGRRKNIIPIMGDATRPEEYAPFVEEVDLIYQDVAQPNQAEIAIANLPFLKLGGEVILMLKTRSVDVTLVPKDVFENTLAELEDAGLIIKDTCWLEPYHHDHACIICEKVSKN
ncbi:fibrillarin-like rRNA/tRNA 2'-O-methyltransferase [Methanoplanus sp. FWC-SCC4]|uniref:Fibrillarin-like rRNA/tRNA 2'-O-methyltransferase n=1 Tax=Methanochimaera problematica TaxID=2609417 RepID=A0AA97FE30_9EURY|nr:fibrillarin-like rRNA/tRNA 2'-O-methyltransferase [Methanoplanus sp. FWC-SCC4]WOF16847.1 fibrillarin-like rRNA/tRNA 2'-O-methyltransferase [Methanoplanus sp. FWC-SCC4]